MIYLYLDSIRYNNFEYPIGTCLKNIDQLIETGQNENVETKHLMRSFSLDIIANVVYSLKSNSYNENDEFSKRVTELFSVRIANIALSFFLPAFINEALDLSLFNTKTAEYFGKLTISLIEERKKNKDVYNDFIEMLMKR